MLNQRKYFILFHPGTSKNSFFDVVMDTNLLTMILRLTKIFFGRRDVRGTILCSERRFRNDIKPMSWYAKPFLKIFFVRDAFPENIQFIQFSKIKYVSGKATLSKKCSDMVYRTMTKFYIVPETSL